MRAARRRLLTGALAMLAAGSAAAQDSIEAHMEGCAKPAVAGGEIVLRNGCNGPVTILFMALNDDRAVERDLPPGGVFSTGATLGGAANRWMYTACPVGYVPSVRFALENAEPILLSLYNCRLVGRPGA